MSDPNGSPDGSPIGSPGDASPETSPVPPGPAPSRATPPGSADRNGRPSSLAPVAGIIRSSSQGSLKGDPQATGGEPHVPRSNSSGSIRPSSAKRPSTTTLPSIVDPPPPPFSTEKLERSRPGTNAAAAPAPGTVKWVPHTHANPKHARFCFICLHGKLEGENDGIDEEVKRQKAEDQDLPSQVELKEMGYLLPAPPNQPSSVGGFRRAGADYERQNLSAMWLLEVTRKVYDESVKAMISEQNTALSLGVDVKLVVHQEDEQDRQALVRLFRLSDEQNMKVKEDIDSLCDWCNKQEARLLDVLPPPKEIGSLPEVEGPSERQKQLLEYQSLLDPSKLKGESALVVSDLLAAMQGSKKDASDLFKAEDLPRPLTQPDMAEVDIVPYPLQLQDIPSYQQMQAAKPTRQPVNALRDPFQRPFLYLADFHETVMPSFESTSSYGQCRVADAVPAEKDWLSTTMSIFQDNNDPEKVGWGVVPPRKRVMPVLIDEPYLPPYDMVGCAEGVGKKIMLRGIWDAELFNREGDMVPPLKDRGRGLYIPIPVVHPDMPVWSAFLSPQKSREEKVTSLIPTLPVRSYTRFRPKKVLADMPQFLWDLVREDAAGQGLWDVIRQRHDIPREEQEMREAEQTRLQKEIDEEEMAEQAQLRGIGSKDSGSVGSAGSRPASRASRPATQQSGRPQTQQSSSATGTGAAGSRPQTQQSQRPGTTQSMAAMTNVAAAPPTSPNTRPSPHQTLTEQSAHLPRMELSAPATPVVTGLPEVPGAGFPSPGSARASSIGMGEELPERHVPHLGETRKVEELLADDRFLDSLAGKLANRLGDAGIQVASTMRPGVHGDRTGAGLSGFHPTIKRPAFAEPGNEIKAALPRALQAGGGIAVDKSAKGAAGRNDNEVHMTNMDVNAFTQEKMRGECYVRLLVHPDAASAKKAIVPYIGDMMNPDISLVMGNNRPHLVVPPKPATYNEDGEMIEDDEFADFEKHDNVAFSFVRHNRYEAIEAIIQQESGILEARDEFGNNMLHVACQNDHRRIAKLLLKNGINVNDQNLAGNTPLHYCFQYNFLHLSDYLISHGADETVANKKGLLPSQGTGTEGGPA